VGVWDVFPIRQVLLLLWSLSVFLDQRYQDMWRRAQSFTESSGWGLLWAMVTLLHPYDACHPFHPYQNHNPDHTHHTYHTRQVTLFYLIAAMLRSIAWGSTSPSWYRAQQARRDVVAATPKSPPNSESAGHATYLDILP
jgi:hypothetical protein